MILRRLSRYGIAFLGVLLAIVILCLYKYRAVIGEYFASSFSAVLTEVGVSLIVIAGLAMMIRSVFR